MKKQGGVSVGVSSILVIFVLLCMVTFAVLSTVTAGAGYRLARSAADTMEAYYQADSAAVRRLAQIDTLLAQAQDGTGEGYPARAAALLEESALCTLQWQDNGQLVAAYTMPAGQEKELAVQLSIGLQPGGGRYAILAWQTASTADWQPDDHLPVWQGGGTGALPQSP